MCLMKWHSLPVGKSAHSIAYVVGFVMPREALYPEDGWKLLRYLTSREGQIEWSKADIGLPPRKSVVEWIGASEDPVKSLFIESAAIAKPWQLGPNQRLMDEIQTALQAIYITDTPVETALARVKERIR